MTKRDKFEKVVEWENREKFWGIIIFSFFMFAFNLGSFIEIFDTSTNYMTLFEFTLFMNLVVSFTVIMVSIILLGDRKVYWRKIK